jgi:D-alanyl-D-alanine carboxypeptidase/D-alanyl-D-alanine-endopeptidase (penicillin-binding protein 4)
MRELSKPAWKKTKVKKNQIPFILSLFLGIVSIGLAVKTETSIANSPPAASENSGKICPAQLPAEINTIVNRPEFDRARWGILIETVSQTQTPKTLYGLEAKKYFTPASTTKLLTTAAVLETMNPNMRIRTSVYGTINGTDGTHHPSLRVVGRGDPSIQQAQLKALAQQLRDRGIRQIDRLIGEDSYFQGSPIHPNWEWDDIQAGYGARVNSLIFNQNAIDLILSPQAVGEPLRVSWADPNEANQWQLENNSVTVERGKPEFVEVGRDLQRPVIRVSGQLMVGVPSEPVYAAVVDPGDRFLQKFRDVLTSQGILVKQTLLETETSDQLTQTTNRELAAIESPPLSELVMEVNQESNNLYAEVLLRLLGVSIPLANHQEIDSSADKGLAVIKTTLTQLGVNPNSYVLADGSGLSRHNFISPEALVQTLQVMAVSDQSPLYRNSLPLREFPGGIQVQSKTGGMSGISSLAGYINSPDYDPLAFAIIVNYSDRSGTVRRQAIDQIIRLLTRLGHC